MLSFAGRKCILRPLKKDDMQKTLKWRNDPEIIENILGYRFPVTEVMEEKWYENNLNDQSRTRVIFAIEDKEDKTLTGFINLNTIDWIARTAYFGITIGEKEKRGKGIGTEAMHLIFKYAFEYLNLRKIYLEVTDYNGAAKITYEKFGFKREGILSKHIYFHNQFYDLYIMSIFKDDYYVIYPNR